MAKRTIGSASVPASDAHEIAERAIPASRYATYALGVTAAGLPLYVVRWKYGPISTTMLEILVLATIALYLLGRREERALRLNRTPYDVAIVLLLMAGAIAVFIPPDRWHALGLYRAYFVEPIAIFYVAVDLLRRPNQVRGVLLGLGLGSSVFAVLNIGAFFVSLAQGTFVLGSPPTALYTSGPEVAMYLEPPLALAAGFVLFASRLRDRMLALLWLGFLVPALILTFSRGAYFAIAVLGLVAVATSRSRVWLAVGLVIAAIAVLQVPLVQRRLAGQFNLGDSATTIRGRLSIFGDALSLVRDHPIFGSGLGGYHYLFRGTIPVIYPHDVWLTFWVEIGLLGVVAFAVIFFGLLYRGWREFARAIGFNRALLWGLSGSLVLWGIHGLVDSPYWKNDMSVEFWLLAAMQVAAIRALRERASPISIGAVAQAPGKADNII